MKYIDADQIRAEIERQKEINLARSDMDKKEKSIYIVEPTENGKAIEIPEVKDFKKLYEDIAKSEWFKKAYHDKSLGDCPFVIDELEESEEQMICPKCGEKMILDEGKVYTSIPPMYGYKCPKCGNYEYSTKKL